MNCVRCNEPVVGMKFYCDKCKRHIEKYGKHPKYPKRPPTLKELESDRTDAISDMKHNILVFAVGLTITLVTYLFARSIQGYYIVCGGAILFGSARFVAAFFRYIKSMIRMTLCRRKMNKELLNQGQI